MDQSTSQFYQENAEALTERYETAEVDSMHQMMLSIYSGFKKLLEVGCGSGRDAAFMIANGFDVTAIDGSQAMIDKAVEHHSELIGRTHKVKLPHELSEELGCFDGVYSIATLMHLNMDALQITLDKVSKLLRKGGLFFFSVSIERDDVNEFGYDEKGRFFNSMSEDKWLSLCDEHGFKSIITQTSGDGLGRDGIVWLSCTVEKV